MDNDLSDERAKFYLAWRDEVLRGKIPVSNEIKYEMRRMDEIYEDEQNYIYDPTILNGFLRFAKREMLKTDGEPFPYILDTYKLWAERLLAWYVIDETTVYDPETEQLIKVKKKKRLIKKMFLIVARGAAKSLFCSLLHSYFLIIYPKRTYQMTIAPTKTQAQEILTPIVTSLRMSKGPLMSFLRVPTPTENVAGAKRNVPLLVPTKEGLFFRPTNSTLEIRPMNASRLQGARPFLTTIDEWLSTSDFGRSVGDIFSAVEQGASKLEDYMLLATSSEGVVRNGPGDILKEELRSILTSEYHAPHVAIFHYKLDDIKELGNPKMWVKAQPNLGKTVSHEAYVLDIERMKAAPDTRPDILAKRFGIPSEGISHFFSIEETKPNPIPKRYGELPKDVFLGVDLSRGDDFASIGFLTPLNNNTFHYETLNMISASSYDKLSLPARAMYDRFINEGSLIVLEGVVLNIKEVYEEFYKRIIVGDIEPMGLGYDPYNADYFIKQFKADFPCEVSAVRQGARTESVPLGNIKHLLEKKKLFFSQQIISYALKNALVLVDTNGNRKLFKARRADKIDPVSSLLNAYVVYNRVFDDYYY